MRRWAEEADVWEATLGKLICGALGGEVDV